MSESRSQFLHQPVEFVARQLYVVLAAWCFLGVVLGVVFT